MGKSPVFRFPSQKIGDDLLNVPIIFLLVVSFFGLFFKNVFVFSTNGKR